MKINSTQDKRIYRFMVYICALIFIGADQIIKAVIQAKLHNVHTELIKGFLSISYCENYGVAFSIGSGNVGLFIVLNIILIGLLVIFYEKNRSRFEGIYGIFVAFAIAGGMSNLLDRIFRGYVVDYIDVNELIKYPIFNLADILIVVGVCGIAFKYCFEKHE